MHSTYGYIPETLTVTFPDWVGVPGSPCVSDQALPILEDASGSISSFERDIDSLDFNGIDQSCFPCQSGMTFDWQSEFANALPFACTLDSLLDDASSSAYTLNEPLSPTSEGTLVNSPTTATLPDLKLAPGEGALVEPQLASFPSLYSDAGFTFPYQPWSTIPALDMYTPMVQEDYSHHQDYDQYWPEQLPAQHEIAAACVVVAGHTTGIDASTDSFALPYVDPASSFSSPVEIQQDTFAVNEEHKSIPVTRSKPRRSASNGKPAGDIDKDNTSQTRKRPRQDTTKRLACNQPGCESMFARTFNLNVHIRSVHFKERIHACKAPGCERAFSRKHDLNRHFQSAHTKLGSPRKTAKERGKAAKSWKSIKKNKDE